MKILLVAMPDSASCFDHIMELPNLALCCLAGNLEGLHEVRILDLVKHRRVAAQALERQMREFSPDLVGISAMSFQIGSARKTAAVCKAIKPDVLTVLGGYHATIMWKEIGEGYDRNLFDYVVRGEGETIFNSLVKTVHSHGDLDRISGLSYRRGGEYRHNPPAPLLNLEGVRPPQRSGRVSGNFLWMGRPFDVSETSRGCTMPCGFCSIRRMYGKTFRLYPDEQVVADLRDVKARGGKGVLFVDDNITLDGPRLKKLCQRFEQEKVNDLFIVMQASVFPIAADLEIAEAMARGGVKMVFLGIESGDERNLRVLGKTKQAPKTRAVVRALRDAGIIVIGGFIVGNPEDREEDVRATYRYVKKIGVDHGIVQCLTPYPKTELRRQLLEQGLVTNPDDLDRYNGFIPNVRTKYLSERDLARIMTGAGIRLYWDPQYVLQNGIWKACPAQAFWMLWNNLKYIFTGYAGRMFLSRHRFEPSLSLDLPDDLRSPSYSEILTPGKDPVYGRAAGPHPL
ncbi:MAG: B12-binding domain-containing radical SAM protein [Acidobacteria bacterium]|nr:MAG: B12-binding domain-containing radical SAM protein [Acidobacteriota bacterium]